MVNWLAVVAACVVSSMLTVFLLALFRPGAYDEGWRRGFREGMRIGYKQGYPKGKVAGVKQGLGEPFTDEWEISEEYLTELMGKG